MTKSYHVALSVDIDRFGDRKLMREFLPMFRAHGCEDAEDIRTMCRAARRQGRTVFPPCDHTGPDGMCLGHAREDAQGDEG